MEISERMLKAYCDNARGYGYEIGRGQTLAPIVQSSEGNPFIHPDWDKDLPDPKGFQLSASDHPLPH